MSDNRFLQSFCALLGAATLVCGAHLFLLATSDWDSATLAIEPPPATAMISIELSPTESDLAPAPVIDQPVPPSEAPQAIASIEEQPQFAPEARLGDQIRLASASATISLAPATKDETAASAPVPQVKSPATSETAVARTEPAGDNNGSGATAEEKVIAPESASEIAQPALPAQSQLAEAARPQQPEPVSDGVEPPVPIAGAEAKPEQPSLQAPLPQRAPKVAKEKPALKLAAKPDQHQKESSRATPRPKPMGLAPAEKPSLSLTQGQPKKSDVGGYSAKIWSALARKKPDAGQRGSTTVTFAIGPEGALRFVRVSQSSGNARLDQLALGTVRNAAPFPPPPVLKDGTAAYTIRIDFH